VLHSLGVQGRMAAIAQMRMQPLGLRVIENSQRLRTSMNATKTHTHTRI
jgi:hypothetical protein